MASARWPPFVVLELYARAGARNQLVILIARVVPSALIPGEIGGADERICGFGILLHLV